MTTHYDLFVEPEVIQQRKQLPGNVRQRIKGLITELATTPRPPQSIPLDTSELNVPADTELLSIRIDSWRIIYAISDAEEWVWVWGMRKRPPYDYDDLVDFVESI